MPMKLLSADDFREAAKAGQRPDGALFRLTATDPVSQDEATRTIRYVFSDATVDHAGDTINQSGWNLAVFKRNPVALFSHMAWEPPIGRASNVGVMGGQLLGDIEFASADIYEFADTIYRLAKGRFLNAVSVGFIPDDWAWSADKDRPFGIDFLKQTLLEISVCPVPCNPNALNEARGVGIDTRPLTQWAERVLDSGETVLMPRREVDALRRAAGQERRRFYIQAARDPTPKQAEALEEAITRWADAPGKTLVLPKGFELRTIKADDWKCGAARDLPLDEEGSWDGAAAAASMFEAAGGDDFDPAKARRGFLAYDAAEPKLRGSYKLPFAQVKDGKLTAMASGIRAAASRLPQTDIPDSVKESAQGVIDHYKAKLDDSGKALGAKAGRRISAATRAKLDEAMSHHQAATQCIMDAIGDDDGPDDEPDADPDDVGPDPTQPPGTVTPEQARIAEVRALKASIAKPA